MDIIIYIILLFGNLSTLYLLYRNITKLIDSHIKKINIFIFLGISLLGMTIFTHIGFDLYIKYFNFN